MNQLVISLLIILLPGILAAIICDKIAQHSKWDYFKFSVYSVMLGWLSYVALQIFLILIPEIKSLNPLNLTWSFKTLNVWKTLFDINGNKSTAIYSEVFYASLTAIILSFIVTAVMNLKYINKIAQTLKVSNKYGDENLFSYYLNSDEIRWVYVRDQSSALTYKGEIVMHSENDNIQEIVLADVDVYNYEDSSFLYHLDSIYLCKKIGEFRIESAMNTQGTNND